METVIKDKYQLVYFQNESFCTIIQRAHEGTRPLFQFIQIHNWHNSLTILPTTKSSLHANIYLFPALCKGVSVRVSD